jgi:flagellin-specific chaperone FliS
MKTPLFSQLGFEAIERSTLDSIFEDLVCEASEEELLSILFGVLQSFLDSAWSAASENDEIGRRHSVYGALDVIAFLRELLHKDGARPANGVLRRFYNAMHRQIIDSCRDGSGEGFRGVRRSIAKVVEPPYSRSFFQNCAQETRMIRSELVRFLCSPGMRRAISPARGQFRIG